MSAANPLNPLLEAEAEVSKQIANAEQQSRQKIQQAEIDADREYARLKKEEEIKFAKESEQVGGKGDATVQEVISRIEKEKQQQQQSFNKAEEQVVQLLLNQVTSCTVQVTEQQRQAFLAIQRQKKLQQEAPVEY